MIITSETQVEEVMKLSGVISYFIKNGVSPISCAGAFPQSLGKLLEIKKVAEPEKFIAGLNAFVARSAEVKE
jgi:hypothetical protein